MDKTLYETLVTSYQENKLREDNRNKEKSYLNAMIRYREIQALKGKGSNLNREKCVIQEGMGVVK